MVSLELSFNSPMFSPVTTQSICLVLAIALAGPARAEEIGFRFIQQPNLPQGELDAIRKLEPWLEKLKLLIQNDPFYPAFLNSFGNKRVRCKFKPTQNDSTIHVEIVYGTRNESSDRSMKALVKRALLSTPIPQDKLLSERGVFFEFTHSVKYSQCNGVTVFPADTFAE
ncbi:MAG: hypothetical protein P4L53_18350 [Candidatus Obscuribacterales bacterium]|nr:hypothetical protein [Candidatus Obscuribacterales bacterium]